MTVESFAAARVRRFARAAGVDPAQVRECELCGVIGFAVDDYERDLLDRLGFRDLCPDCAPDSGSDRAA